MANYKNPEMRKATEQMKPMPRKNGKESIGTPTPKIKITGGSVSTREPMTSSSAMSGMMKSSVPRTTTSDNKNVKPLYGKIGGSIR